MSTADDIASLTNPQEFTRLCNALLYAEHGDAFLAIDDDRGDGGNDGYLTTERRMFAMHCPKRPHNRGIDTVIRNKMIGDLGKARALRDAGAWDVLQWTFICTYPMPEHIAAEIQKLSAGFGVSASWIGPNELAQTLDRFPHVRDAFPWLSISSVRHELHDLAAGIDAARGLPAGSTPRARRLVRERPDYWQYMLAAEELSAGLRLLDSQRRDLKLGITRARALRLEPIDTLNAARSAFAEVSVTLDNLRALWAPNVLDEVFEGTDEDPAAAVIHYAGAWIFAYSTFLRHAAEVTAWRVPSGSAALLPGLLVEFVQGPVRQLEQFVADYQVAVDQLATDDDAPPELSVHVVFAVEPDGVEQRFDDAITALETELRAQSFGE